VNVFTTSYVVPVSVSRGIPLQYSTWYYNQAMKADEVAEFKAAIVREANDHTSSGHWEVWEKPNIPKGQDILSAVWAFFLQSISTRHV
jgi:hypothetical protein